MLLDVGVAVASTERLALGVRKLCVRCVIVCVILEEGLDDILYEIDAVTVVVYVNIWDTEAFDVGDILSVAVEDAVG
jgi:hypothetical protein